MLLHHLPKHVTSLFCFLTSQHSDLKPEAATAFGRLCQRNDTIYLTNGSMRGSGTRTADSAVSDICHIWHNITIPAPHPFPPAVTGIDYLIRRIDLIISPKKPNVVWILRPIYPPSAPELLKREDGEMFACHGSFKQLNISCFVLFCTHFLVVFFLCFLQGDLMM